MSAITGGRTWLLGLLIVPTLAGFLFLDAGVGLFLGVATAATIIILAARATGDDPIEIAEPGPGVAAGVLVLAVDAIDDTRTAGAVAAVAERARGESPDEGVLVVAPARSGLLDRWADDLEQGRFESQRVLTISLATLTAAGVEAEGRVGDGDPLRAAEDALRTYAASEVVVVAAEGEFDRPIATLERRLDRPLRRVGVPAPEAGLRQPR